MKNNLKTLLMDIDKAEVSDVGQNAANERYREALRAEAEVTDERIDRADKGQGDFTVYELVFAAGFRCLCGAGMAYPEGIGCRGAWYCSAILLGQAAHSAAHSPAHPFAFYEVKSECQPSAVGATTRPFGTHVETVPFYVCKNCGNTGESEPYRNERRDVLKSIICSTCGERYLNDDGSSNPKMKTRFFHQVIDDAERGAAG